MKIKWYHAVWLAVPAAFAVHFTDMEAATFVVSAIAIIPLAGLLGRSTEALSARVGPGLGGLVNATLGNAAELIIAGLALYRGMPELVKASITGSIIGNILLVMGLSCFCGGLRHKEQKFSRIPAEQGAALLFVAVAALAIPSLFATMGTDIPHEHVKTISVALSVILMITYFAGLLFSLVTHRHLYAEEVDENHAPWSRGRIALGLLVSAGLISVLAEFLVGSVEAASKQLGLSQMFIGVIVVAIVGNAAEHSSAVLAAVRNKMTLSMTIAIESSKQVALFVAPFLIFLSLVLNKPLDLQFTLLELGAIGISVITVALLTLDGRSNWLEGVQLLAVYAILGVAFFFAV